MVSVGPGVRSPLSDLLLDLYRIARQVPCAGFKEAVFGCLKRQIHFDSGVWGTFVRPAGAMRVHTGHLHRQPAAMRVSYERVAHHDPLNSATVAHPGQTFSYTVADHAETLHPDLLAHTLRFGISHALATSVAEPELQIWTSVALYREARSPRFTEADRRLKQDALPHLVEAWHLNTFHFLDQTSGSARARKARALIDELGYLYSAEPGFAGLLGLEFPGWEGPLAPPQIVGSGTGSEYRGAAVVTECLTALEDGLKLVSVRAISDVDRLTRREREVATDFALGLTYREISAARGTSPATVRNQLRSVYAKLGVSSKVELAQRMGSAD